MNKTALAKWFDVVTRIVARVEPLGFHLVDLDQAKTEFVRMQFMIDNGLGPDDMTDDRLKP